MNLLRGAPELDGRSRRPQPFVRRHGFHRAQHCSRHRQHGVAFDPDEPDLPDDLGPDQLYQPRARKRADHDLKVVGHDGYSFAAHGVKCEIDDRIRFYLRRRRLAHRGEGGVDDLPLVHMRRQQAERQLRGR